MQVATTVQSALQCQDQTRSWESNFTALSTKTRRRLQGSGYRPRTFAVESMALTWVLPIQVVVVGEGNSGAQILADVSIVAADVMWVTSKEPEYLPKEMSGKEVFDTADKKLRAFLSEPADTPADNKAIMLQQESSFLRARSHSLIHCEIKYKKTQTQYNLYQECVF
eukprot:1117927-Rhodomonas_salina.3